MKRKFQPIDYAGMDLRTVTRRDPISVRQLANPISCDLRYMTPLLVFGETKTCLELGAANIDPNHQKLQDKIAAALKLLSFREQHVLIQFWRSHEVGKHQLLTTTDQPFGYGVTDVGLCSYRQESEGRSLIVDKDHGEKDCSPAARVFRGGLPEWTSDLNNYTPKHFPQQECAILCNLHGYLAVPVFDSNTRLCVGVLELLTSSKYMNYAYEVQQIHNALKTVELTSPQEFGFPALYVPNEHRQNDYNKIHSILKMVCDIHNVPLAQTWAVSQKSSFVFHEKAIQKSCSSFDTGCVGKVCMSTANLPFCVKDLTRWSFREACIRRHLDKSCGFVGKALLTRSSCFCEDATKLSEEEYPLVPNACMNRLTSCFAIFLRSVETNDEYVLEFFLQPDIKGSGHILNLVQTLKQNIPIGSGFELGDNSCIGISTDMSIHMEPVVIDISSDCMADNFTSSDSESLMATCSTNLLSPTNLSLEKTWVTDTDAGEKCKKHKIESDTTMMVTAEVSFDENMEVFDFPGSLKLSYLKKKVRHKFKLKGKRFRLKYRDEDDDLILIACNVDLKLAVDTIGSNNRIKLTCLLG